MPQMVVRFLVAFTSIKGTDSIGPFGLQFNRWLPDDERDCLKLPTDDVGADVEVWCERRGYVKDGYIKYHQTRRAVESAIIPLQARLDGGDLRGRIILNDVDSETLAAVEEDRHGDPLYIALGKRVVNRIFYPSVSPLVRILRTHYGQYWLPELDAWDSRRVNLGAYCNNHLFFWSLDGNQPLKRFMPENPVFTIDVGIMGGPMDYLREADWRSLQDLVQNRFSPSPAAETLGRAHGFVDSDEWRYALVEGVTALELAIGEYARSRIATAPSAMNKLGPFWTLNLPARVIAAAAFSGVVPERDLDSTLKAIDHRNEVVHEGKPFRESVKSDLPALLRTAAAFIQGPKFRFARYTTSNFLDRTSG
jgi:hypothetical protein